MISKVKKVNNANKADIDSVGNNKIVMLDNIIKQLSDKKLIGSYLGLMMLMTMLILYSEIAYAKFEPDSAVKAATEPLINVIKDHWGKAVMLTGGTSALLGEGDGRQRAIRAGISAGAAGAVILGMQALLL